MQKGGWKTRKYWLNLLRAFLVSLLSVALVACYVIYPWWKGNLRLHPPRSYACCQTPADLGLDYADASFETRDGLTLKGWYIPSHNHAAIIIAHGAGGNRSSHLDQAAELNRAGFGVLLIELRDHGDSDGNVISFSGEDVLAGVQYLRGKGEIDQGKIGVMGCSLGAMVSIQAAALTSDIRAVIADGLSPAAIEDEPPPRNVGEALMLPAYFTEYIVWSLQGAAPPVSITKALGKLGSRPVLFIAGGALDPEVQFAQNFYSRTPGPKEIWIAPGAGHCGGWQAQKEAYIKLTNAFFENTLLAPR